MMPPGPQPEYPFLRHPCVSPAMERHYLAWRSFDQGAACGRPSSGDDEAEGHAGPPSSATCAG